MRDALEAIVIVALIAGIRLRACEVVVYFSSR